MRRFSYSTIKTLVVSLVFFFSFPTYASFEQASSFVKAEESNEAEVFSFESDNSSYYVGDEFTVRLVVDTQGKEVVKVVADVVFDPEYLEFVDSLPGQQFLEESGLMLGVTGVETTLEEGSIILEWVGEGEVFNGRDTFVEVKFKALKKGSATVALGAPMTAEERENQEEVIQNLEQQREEGLLPEEEGLSTEELASRLGLIQSEEMRRQMKNYLMTKDGEGQSFQDSVSIDLELEERPSEPKNILQKIWAKINDLLQKLFGGVDVSSVLLWGGVGVVVLAMAFLGYSLFKEPAKTSKIKASENKDEKKSINFTEKTKKAKN